MGLFKFLCKKFKCTSSCQFNTDELFDCNKLNHNLNMYDLKHKDIITIMNILEKRDMKPSYPIITEI